MVYRVFFIVLVAVFIFAGYLFLGWKREKDFLRDVRESYAMAEQWFLKNQKENGLFYYIYEPRKGFYPNKNNAIRQLMGSRLLAELSHDDPSFNIMHKKNLDFIFNNWYRENGGVGYIYLYNKSKLGANAMALRVLVYSPFFNLYKDRAQRLADGILSLINGDGSFEPWFIKPDYGYDKDRLLTFYSGEALLSLIEYYQKVGDKKYLDAAVKSQDFYINRYVVNMKNNYYPAYVPWHTLSLYKLYKITGDRKYADAVFALNDELLKIQDTRQYIGRFYNKDFPEYGAPHSASDGVYTEGLAYAYDLARDIGDKARERTYKKALKIAARNLITLQYRDEDIKMKFERWRLLGAFKYNINDGRIRIDTVQHTMDAFRKIIDIF